VNNELELFKYQPDLWILMRQRTIFLLGWCRFLCDFIFFAQCLGVMVVPALQGGSIL
jgi:hypothetical protein